MNPERAGEMALALTEDRRESVRHAAINQIVSFGAPGKTLVNSYALIRWSPVPFTAP
jgi:hypothetical protein